MLFKKYLRNLITIILTSFLIISFSSCSQQKEFEKTKPNILFIPVDDLRPELGCYGNEIIKTPNIDKLAEQGVVFTRTYCQQAVCNPSRASLLTGLRPDSLQVWDLETNFRSNVPDAVTLPQFFKLNGYTTIGIGKTFHNNIPDSLSWTSKPHIEGFPFDPDAVYANEENLSIQKQKIQKMIEAGRSRVDQYGHWYVKANATENADVDDDTYFDGAQTTLAIEILRELKSEEKPFFLSVGYYRPHLPFNAPKKYWDIYNKEDLPLSKNQFVPSDSPEYSVHGDAELRSYSDMHDLPFPSEKSWENSRQQGLIHGYYASVSYIDAQIGRLINELDRLGLRENTIIVLWGDHGWKLGDHNGWGKMTNYEIDTRVPLIISGANVIAKGEKSSALTEFVDIYPTLCELSGFDIPEYLQGSSLKPLLENPNTEWKTAAFSQYLLGRFGPKETRKQERMGYAMRTNQYRYVEWYSWNKKEKRKGEYLGNELYDHFVDSLENNNLSNKSEYFKTVELLSEKLKLGWKNSLPH